MSHVKTHLNACICFASGPFVALDPPLDIHHHSTCPSNTISNYAWINKGLINKVHSGPRKYFSFNNGFPNYQIKAVSSLERQLYTMAAGHALKGQPRHDQQSMESEC